MYRVVQLQASDTLIWQSVDLLHIQYSVRTKDQKRKIGATQRKDEMAEGGRTALNLCKKWTNA